MAMHVNVEPVFDISHGICNNYFDAIKYVGEWPFLLLLTITFNMPHMPFDEDRFMHTICHALENYFEMVDDGNDPLFQEMLPHMLWDKGQLDRANDDSFTQTIFEEVKNASLWQKKGGRV